MKRGFGSDNHSGICPEVMEAIARVNKEHALAYGDDEYCAATEAKFRDQFGLSASPVYSFCSLDTLIKENLREKTPWRIDATVFASCSPWRCQLCICTWWCHGHQLT